MHVGQCLSTLSDRGNPMGPDRAGILARRLARLLRKWLLRNGRELLRIEAGKEEAKLKELSGLGTGVIEELAMVNDISYAYVRWSSGKTGYYLTGEDGVYELLRVKDPVGTAGEYHDHAKIHSGGSATTALGTFVAYFMPRFCAFFWFVALT